jgi:hypothetical protein
VLGAQLQDNCQRLGLPPLGRPGAPAHCRATQLQELWSVGCMAQHFRIPCQATLPLQKQQNPSPIPATDRQRHSPLSPLCIRSCMCHTACAIPSTHRKINTTHVLTPQSVQLLAQANMCRADRIERASTMTATAPKQLAPPSATDRAAMHTLSSSFGPCMCHTTCPGHGQCPLWSPKPRRKTHALTPLHNCQKGQTCPPKSNKG